MFESHHATKTNRGTIEYLGVRSDIYYLFDERHFPVSICPPPELQLDGHGVIL